jgi:hypothetical protein
MLSEQQYADMIAQLGRRNILSISGGRVIKLPKGVRLPVSSGISVVVIYDEGSDTYTVKREFCRKVRGDEVIYDHGQRTEVYCEQLAETAYVAGMYKSYDQGQAWVMEAARRV